VGKSKIQKQQKRADRARVAANERSHQEPDRRDPIDTLAHVFLGE